MKTYFENKKSLLIVLLLFIFCFVIARVYTDGITILGEGTTDRPLTLANQIKSTTFGGTRTIKINADLGYPAGTYIGCVFPAGNSFGLEDFIGSSLQSKNGMMQCMDTLMLSQGDTVYTIQMDKSPYLKLACTDSLTFKNTSFTIPISHLSFIDNFLGKGMDVQLFSKYQIVNATIDSVGKDSIRFVYMNIPTNIMNVDFVSDKSDPSGINANKNAADSTLYKQSGGVQSISMYNFNFPATKGVFDYGSIYNSSLDTLFYISLDSIFPKNAKLQNIKEWLLCFAPPNGSGTLDTWLHLQIDSADHRSLILERNPNASDNTNPSNNLTFTVWDQTNGWHASQNDVPSATGYHGKFNWNKDKLTLTPTSPDIQHLSGKSILFKRGGIYGTIIDMDSLLYDPSYTSVEDISFDISSKSILLNSDIFSVNRYGQTNILEHTNRPIKSIQINSTRTNFTTDVFKKGLVLIDTIFYAKYPYRPHDAYSQDAGICSPYYSGKIYGVEQPEANDIVLQPFEDFPVDPRYISDGKGGMKWNTNYVKWLIPPQDGDYSGNGAAYLVKMFYHPNRGDGYSQHAPTDSALVFVPQADVHWGRWDNDNHGWIWLVPTKNRRNIPLGACYVGKWTDSPRFAIYSSQGDKPWNYSYPLVKVAGNDTTYAPNIVDPSIPYSDADGNVLYTNIPNLIITDTTSAKNVVFADMKYNYVFKNGGLTPQRNLYLTDTTAWHHDSVSVGKLSFFPSVDAAKLQLHRNYIDISQLVQPLPTPKLNRIWAVDSISEKVEQGKSKITGFTALTFNPQPGESPSSGDYIITHGHSVSQITERSVLTEPMIQIGGISTTPNTINMNFAHGFSFSNSVGALSTWSTWNDTIYMKDIYGNPLQDYSSPCLCVNQNGSIAQYDGSGNFITVSGDGSTTTQIDITITKDTVIGGKQYLTADKALFKKFGDEVTFIDRFGRKWEWDKNNQVHVNADTVKMFLTTLGTQQNKIGVLIPCADVPYIGQTMSYYVSQQYMNGTGGAFVQPIDSIHNLIRGNGKLSFDERFMFTVPTYDCKKKQIIKESLPTLYISKDSYTNKDGLVVHIGFWSRLIRKLFSFLFSWK